ncbi:MAG: Uma2 family endonuclease [Candidatus Poribacteria bacterium]|nr:Uma2 family endonuclease [Candidatus Poribacteria bacterium]
MSSTAAQTYLTPEEYLAWERKADIKHEYLRGAIIAMSGASRAHSLIVTNISGELYIQLKGGTCEVHTNDMRVRTSPETSYFYPDVVVVCDKPRFEDNTFDTLLNPIVLVEVLSPSTQVYDRGEKFKHYQQLASLREYILVSQDEVGVERYRRQGTEWQPAEFRSLEDVLSLTSIDCELSLEDIYGRVEFRENQL